MWYSACVCVFTRHMCYTYSNLTLFQFLTWSVVFQPLGASDYLEMAQLFDTVFIRHVPMLTLTLKDQARRFTTLIDNFYNYKVSADKPALGLLLENTSPYMISLITSVQGEVLCLHLEISLHLTICWITPQTFTTHYITKSMWTPKQSPVGNYWAFRPPLFCEGFLQDYGFSPIWCHKNSSEVDCWLVIRPDSESVFQFIPKVLDRSIMLKFEKRASQNSKV